ncbi:MAG TPA: ABC transporter ATP-binding protein [Polyangiaceae bacterium]
MTEEVLVVSKLQKTFRKPFSGRKVEAVRGVSFDVRRGEVFGFLGPNGAGKTTAIKMLTGLIFPTGGEATIFGQRVPSPEAMRRVGFLPENPYVYPYLTPREFVTLCGQLSGVSGKKLTARVEEVIARVGMSEAIDRPVQALSKGMGQRVGLAAALVHDPDFLILDEPMSGLDPVGRKDVRDLILEERGRGKTVFFSTHILNDAEQLCDRVCILRQGEVVLSGTLSELLSTSDARNEVALDGVGDGCREALGKLGLHGTRMGHHLVYDVEGYDRVRELIETAHANGARVASLVPKRETLEALFVRRAL